MDIEVQCIGGETSQTTNLKFVFRDDVRTQRFEPFWGHEMFWHLMNDFGALSRVEFTEENAQNRALRRLAHAG